MGNCTSSYLSLFYLRIFAFLFMKTVTWGQLCQQLVKPVVYICFCFSIYKNFNAEASVLAAGVATIVAFLSNKFLAIFAFSIADIKLAAIYVLS